MPNENENKDDQKDQNNADQKNDQKDENPKKDDKKQDQKNYNDDLLSILEKDFIDKLKDKIALEDYAEYDQKTRIKLFRSLDKSLNVIAPNTNTDKKDDKKKEKEKGQSFDPTAPDPPADSSKRQTLLERNNMRDYLADLRKKNSVLNITDKIRGKESEKNQ